ncbi:hypothetical protein DSECCO2_457000 [anaerobic digester metagenome]
MRSKGAPEGAPLHFTGYASARQTLFFYFSEINNPLNFNARQKSFLFFSGKMKIMNRGKSVFSCLLSEMVGFFLTFQLLCKTGKYSARERSGAGFCRFYGMD